MPSEQNQVHIFSSYICEAHIYTIFMASYYFPDWSYLKNFHLDIYVVFTGDRYGVEALGFGIWVRD